MKSFLWQVCEGNWVDLRYVVTVRAFNTSYNDGAYVDVHLLLPGEKEKHQIERIEFTMTARGTAYHYATRAADRLAEAVNEWRTKDTEITVRDEEER